jgi:predicted TIM-barrel fold metal-dependent hydrolase
MIIDAHVHIFEEIHGQIGTGFTRDMGYGRVDTGNGQNQMLPPLNLKTQHTMEMMIAHLDWAGVDKAIMLQGSFYGECNKYVREAASRYPDRLIAAAFVDPWIENSRQRFDEVFSFPEFRILKLEISDAAGLFGLHPQASLDMASISWLWDELEQRGLVLTIDMGAIGGRSYQTKQIRAIAESHPNLKIVIPHLAQPTPVAEEDLFRWKMWQEQIDLGKLPNVWFDNSATAWYLPGEMFPYPTAGRYLRMAMDRIGPEKVMWGTDLPALFSLMTYPQLLKMAQIHSDHLAPKEKALFLGETAMKVYLG